MGLDIETLKAANEELRSAQPSKPIWMWKMTVRQDFLDVLIEEDMAHYDQALKRWRVKDGPQLIVDEVSP